MAIQGSRLRMKCANLECHTILSNGAKWASKKCGRCCRIEREKKGIFL